MRLTRPQPRTDNRSPVASPDQATPTEADVQHPRHGSKERQEHEPARPTDWLRVALPIIAVAVFVILAWRHGYFDLKDPRKLDAAAQRVQDVPWLGPIFVAVYAGLAMFA